VVTGQREGEAMGSAFDIKTKMITCNGQQVTNKLNQVFGNPNTPQYQKAQANNTFGDIQNVQGNWKDLIIAYLVAGVDVGNEWPAWCAYLEQLGAGATGTQGPLNIYLIAQARNTALTANPPQGMDTTTNGNGGPVHTHPGSGSQPSTIDSPCPP
jgi:hypothetical protein